MTPAEIAALRERLAQYALDAERCQLSQGAADLRAALALLDAQAAEIARLEKDVTLLMRQTGFLQDDIRRLTAERERARADAIEEAARVCDAEEAYLDDASEPELYTCSGTASVCAERIRALAPAPAAEVAG